MPITFGVWVRKTREKQGRTLRDVAPFAQTSFSHLWAIEQGQHDPGLKGAEKIANALGFELWQALADASVQVQLEDVQMAPEG